MVKIKKSKQQRYKETYRFLEKMGCKIEDLESAYEDDEGLRDALADLWDDVYDVIMFVLHPRMAPKTFYEMAKEDGTLPDNLLKQPSPH